MLPPPSSLGFLALFRIVTRGRRLRSVQRIGVCLGYAPAWAAMGCVAILVHAMPARAQYLPH
jgi:hypothetical protein